MTLQHWCFPRPPCPPHFKSERCAALPCPLSVLLLWRKWGVLAWLRSRSAGSTCYRLRQAGRMRTMHNCPRPLLCLTDQCGSPPPQFWLGNASGPLSLGVCSVPQLSLRHRALESLAGPCSGCCPSSAFFTVSSWPNTGLSHPSLQKPDPSALPD